jgi:hypothetical protein
VQAKVAVHSSAEDHLSFATQLLNLFDPADDRCRSWAERIHRARRRLVDDHYYAAVIGEPEAGASTFINALLEAELFAAGVRPAGAAAAVWVSYGRRPTIRVGFRDGQICSAVSSSPAGPATGQRVRGIEPAEEFGLELTTAQICERLRRLDPVDALRVVTTDDVVAPEVVSVELEYPAPLLAGGLVLIVPPGAVSGDQERSAALAQITRQVAADADVTVVVTEESSLLPECVAEFLTEALDEGLLARCAFVVTGADRIEPEQFDESRREGAERIAKLLALTDPPIAWAAPHRAVRALRSEAGPVTDAEAEYANTDTDSDMDIDADTNADVNTDLTIVAASWIERFDRTRRWLRRLAEDLRPAAVADTALRLVQGLLAEQDVELAAALGDLERRRQSLADIAPADMADFLSGQLEKSVQMLTAAEHEVLTRVQDLAWTAARETEAAISKAIEPCGSGKAIDRVLREQVPPLVESGLRGLVQDTRSIARSRVGDRFEEVAAELRSAFVADYAELVQIDPAPLAGDLVSLGLTSSAFGSAEFEAARTVSAEDAKRDAWSLGGGAGTGALLGSLIFPGLGTVVGAGLGLMLGFVAMGRIETARVRAVDKASAAVREHFDAAGDRLMGAVGDLADGSRAELREQARWYRSEYEKAVRVLQYVYREKQDLLEARYETLARVRQQAMVHRAVIVADRSRLLAVSRFHTTDPFGGSDD